MPSTGRPRVRSNRRTQQAQVQAQAQAAQSHAQAQAQAHARAQAQAQAQAQHNRMKEEPGVQLHDEADLISFRADALNRFITNQEYLENVTSKLVHTSKIIPPSLYHLLPKRKEEDYGKLNPEEIYFGDLEFMRYKEKALLEEISKLRTVDYTKADDYLPEDPEYRYQKEKTDKLTEIQSRLNDKSSIDVLEKEINEILKEYKEKFNKKYEVSPEVKKYSVSIEKVSENLKVESAPENYNPKSINSFININNDSDKISKSQYPGANLDPNIGPVNIDAGNYHEASAGMYLHEYGQANAFTSNGHVVPPNFTMSLANQEVKHDGVQVKNGPELHQGPHQGVQLNGGVAQYHKADHEDQVRDPMVDEDDMNALFKENGGDLDPNQAIVSDDMGDLINFDDNDEMMGGSAFDQDFLSQIDHSME